MANFFLRTTILSSVSAFLMLSPPAVAEDAQGSDRPESPSATPSLQTMDYIVVTASRRSEKLLDVPISITAVTSETLQMSGANTFIDYASSVPNLSFAQTGIGSSNARTIAIRGIGDAGTTGFYIDDTPVPESIDPKVLDVSRIEVLRGPQGTLYGARSMGGTVRLITEQPNVDEFSARGHAAVSTTKNTTRPNYQLDGAINFPVSDKVALRLVGFYDDQAGYFDRAYGPYAVDPIGVVEGVGRNRTRGFSASALLQLSDSFSIVPRVLYQRTTTTGPSYVDVAIAPSPQSTILKSESLTQRRVFDIPEGSEDEWLLLTMTGRVETEIGDFISSTSWFKRDTSDTEDYTDFIYSAFGISPLPASITKDNGNRNFTQEVRFSSNFGGPFELVAGGYYNHAANTGIFDGMSVPGLNAATGGALGTNLVIDWYQRSKQEELAGYIEGVFKVTSKLSLIGGVRVFEIKTSTDPELRDGIALGGPSVRPAASTKESGYTPKVSVQYKASDNAQVYASASQGFRAGGVNGPIPSTFGCDEQLAAIGRSRDDVSDYESDTVWSYEIGAKGSLPGGGLTASVAGYRIDWSDIQQNVTLACGFGFRTNAGKARAEGFEVEITARPMPGLSLGGGIGYTDATFRETIAGTKFQPGDRVPGIPKYTLNGFIDYVTPVAGEVEGFFHGDVKYVSSSISAVNATVNPGTGALVPRIRPKSTLVNLRVGARQGPYELSLFAKNIFNEIASLGDPIPVSAEPPIRARVGIAQPRTLGVDFRASF